MFSSNGNLEPSIITDEKPPSIQALRISKSAPWSKRNAIGTVVVLVVYHIMIAIGKRTGTIAKDDPDVA